MPTGDIYPPGEPFSAPSLDSDANKKKSSNKEEQETEKKPKRGIERRYIRAKLLRDLWEEYQKPDISRADKIKLAGLLSRLTDKRKQAPKPIFG